MDYSGDMRLKKRKDLNAKYAQYCADTTEIGSVYAIDIRGHIRYLLLVLLIFY